MKTNYVKHFLTAMLFAVLPVGFAFAEVPSREGEPSVSYKFISVDGQNIFYREAGDRTNPTILLLQGFPTSSQMFRGLIPQLADKYHVIAPDYPGFGQISMPGVAEFEYSFDNLARILEKFTEQDGINKYSLYLQDYGAPIGFRIAEKNPNKVQALIIQNGNAYEEGLREFWIPFNAYWQDRSETNVNALRNFLTLEAKQWQWSHETRDQQIINPDNWTLDQAYLDRTGNQAIQLELFYSYGSNPPLYPQWQGRRTFVNINRRRLSSGG